MKEEIKVTVIVPAYNTEKYISRMIECLLIQTYSNLQLIFIDDGSTDRTAEIIRGYTDSRIEYYYQKNAGVSAARNEGLKRAKGEKIFFFDSDDTFEPNLIAECVAFAKANNVESVLYGYGNRVNGKVTDEHIFKINGIYRNEQIIDEVMPAFLGHSFSDVNRWLKGECGQREGKEHTALWRIMLDGSVIRKNRLYFDTKLSLGEDTKFINIYLLFTHSIGVLQETLYYLTIREGSANVISNSNSILMAQNKEKLILARKEIDEIAAKKGRDIHGYWQGTLVLSAVQLALRLSHERGGSTPWCAYCHYVKNAEVQSAIKSFHLDALTIKAMPFLLLKMKLYRLLYGFFKITPQVLIDRLL